MSGSVKQAASRLAEPVVTQLGYEYVDTEYAKQGPDWLLSVYIDKPSGITIEDCEIVSKALEPVFDKEDPVPGPYTLVVSSPGLDRPLKTQKDFERATGEQVDVKLYRSFMGTKELSGVLVRYDPDGFTIERGDDEITFTNSEVARVNRHFEF